MIKTLYWYLFGWLRLFVSLPILLKVKYLDKRKRFADKEKLVTKTTKKIARFLFYLSGSKIDIKGLENVPQNRPVLFVSNHQSHMDNAVIHGFIHKSKGFLSDIEAKKLPILNRWMKHMNCVFIDRKDTRQSFESINRGIELLKEGKSLVVYPEGKISEDGLIDEFKRGSMRLALNSGVPIVPIAINGTNKVMNREGTRIKSGKVKCIIAKPIETKDLSRDQAKTLADVVRSVIDKNLQLIKS